MWVGVVASEGEIVEIEVEDAILLGVEGHRGQRSGVAGKLQTALVDVIVVDVGVAEGVNEIAGLETTGLGNHHGEEGVAGNVEGDAKEYVGGALVELAAEAAVGNIELEEDMAGREVHLVNLAHVPSRHEEPAGIGIALDIVDEVGNLVDF